MAHEKTEGSEPSFGPYECIRLLGSSNDKTVYLARHKATNQEVALRIVELPSHNQNDILALANTHLGIVQSLQIPHIVPILDFGSEGTALYIAMQLVRGGSLMNRLTKCEDDNAPLPSLGEVAEFLEVMALTIDMIHEEDLTHGQIEPRNILFDEAGQYYLADIGLARITKIAFALHSTGSFFAGEYSAPELWLGERATPSSDQYALAGTIYHLVTGKPPYDAPTIYGLMQKHTEGMIFPPNYYRPDVPNSLTIPFVQAMGKEPDYRFVNAMEFSEAFAQTIEGHEGEQTGFFD